MLNGPNSSPAPPQDDVLDPAAQVATMRCDVLIADDRELFRESLRLAMDTETDIRVVAELDAATHVVSEAGRSRPRVALLNADLPGCDPIELARDLGAEQPRCNVLFLLERQDPAFLEDAIKAGARGCVTRGTPLADLVDALRRAARGQMLIPPGMLTDLIDRLIHHSVVRDEAARRVGRLTARERGVLALLADGRSNESIARTLYISPFTTRTHVQNLLRKLEVHSRLEAAMFVARNGLGEELLEQIS